MIFDPRSNLWSKLCFDSFYKRLASRLLDRFLRNRFLHFCVILFLQGFPCPHGQDRFYINFVNLIDFIVFLTQLCCVILLHIVLFRYTSRHSRHQILQICWFLEPWFGPGPDWTTPSRHSTKSSPYRPKWPSEPFPDTFSLGTLRGSIFVKIHEFWCRPYCRLLKQNALLVL